jgi:hypothetical protein
MNIQEILQLPTAQEQIAQLKNKIILTADIALVAKQIDPLQHGIFDELLRPNKQVKGDSGTAAREEAVARIAIPMQKLLVKRTNSILFGNPVVLKAEPTTEQQKGVLRAIKRILEDNKELTMNREVGRKVMSECEAAEVWFPVESPHEDYGFPAKYKLRHAVFSPLLGDELYPLFDELGDLIAFSRLYTVLSRKYFETYTADLYRRWEYNSGGYEVILERKNPIGKIPVVYSYQEFPEWHDVQHVIDRLEKLLSNFADTNDYHGSPKIFVTGTVKGFAKKGETGAIIEGDVNSKAEYLTWANAPESVKLEIETLFNLIFTMTQTPDFSFQSMKGIGDISGIALRLLFIDAYLKAEDKKEIFDAHMKRRISILKAFVGDLNTAWKEAARMNISPEITPYILRDTKAEIEMIVTANGNKGVVSQKTSVALAGLALDADKEYEQIQKEEQDSSMTDLFQPTK